MPIQTNVQLEKTTPEYLYFLINGTLDREDYLEIIPKVNQAIERNNKIKLLMELTDFQGWTIGAAWEDLEFRVSHVNRIECIAVVGDEQWINGMATFVKAFPRTKVQFFEPDQREDAREWLLQKTVN